MGNSYSTFKPQLVVRTFRLEKIDDQRLAVAAKARHKTPSLLVREIVARYLDQLDIEAEAKGNAAA